MEFEVTELRRNHELNRYFATIFFGDYTGNYELRTDAHLRLVEMPDKKTREFSVLNGFDCPFNGDGERPYLSVEGLDDISQQHESALRDAILQFVEDEYTEHIDTKHQ